MIPRTGFYLQEEEQWFGKASQKAESVSLLSISPALSRSSDLVPLQLLIPVYSTIKASEERQYQVWGRDWRERSVHSKQSIFPEQDWGDPHQRTKRRTVPPRTFALPNRSGESLPASLGSLPSFQASLESHERRHSLNTFMLSCENGEEINERFINTLLHPRKQYRWLLIHPNVYLTTS